MSVQCRQAPIKTTGQRAVNMFRLPFPGLVARSLKIQGTARMPDGCPLQTPHPQPLPSPPSPPPPHHSIRQRQIAVPCSHPPPPPTATDRDRWLSLALTSPPPPHPHPPSPTPHSSRQSKKAVPCCRIMHQTKRTVCMIFDCEYFRLLTRRIPVWLFR